MISSTKVCIKQALIFKIWMYYGAIMSVYSQKIATKKAIKNPLFSAIQDTQVPFKSYLKKTLFGVLKFKYLQNHMAKF